MALSVLRKWHGSPAAQIDKLMNGKVHSKVLASGLRKACHAASSARVLSVSTVVKVIAVGSEPLAQAASTRSA